MAKVNVSYTKGDWDTTQKKWAYTIHAGATDMDKTYDGTRQLHCINTDEYIPSYDNYWGYSKTDKISSQDIGVVYVAPGVEVKVTVDLNYKNTNGDTGFSTNGYVIIKGDDAPVVVMTPKISDLQVGASYISPAGDTIFPITWKASDINWPLNCVIEVAKNTSDSKWFIKATTDDTVKRNLTYKFSIDGGEATGFSSNIWIDKGSYGEFIVRVTIKNQVDTDIRTADKTTTFKVRPPKFAWSPGHEPQYNNKVDTLLATDWSNLQLNVNQVRQYLGKGDARFSTVGGGMKILASYYNEFVTAMSDLPINNYYRPTQKKGLSSGYTAEQADTITAKCINDLRDAINSVV